MTKESFLAVDEDSEAKLKRKIKLTDKLLKNLKSTLKLLFLSYSIKKN